MRPSLGSENSTGSGFGLFPGLDSHPCDCMGSLHLCEAVLLKTWDILTAWPETSTAPWTPGWAESQRHTASFSHLQHITLPKQCIRLKKSLI